MDHRSDVMTRLFDGWFLETSLTSCKLPRAGVFARPTGSINIALLFAGWSPSVLMSEIFLRHVFVPANREPPVIMMLDSSVLDTSDLYSLEFRMQAVEHVFCKHRMLCTLQPMITPAGPCQVSSD